MNVNDEDNEIPQQTVNVIDDLMTNLKSIRKKV